MSEKKQRALELLKRGNKLMDVAKELSLEITEIRELQGLMLNEVGKNKQNKLNG